MRPDSSTAHPGRHSRVQPHDPRSTGRRAELAGRTASRAAPPPTSAPVPADAPYPAPDAREQHSAACRRQRALRSLKRRNAYGSTSELPLRCPAEFSCSGLRPLSAEALRARSVLCISSIMIGDWCGRHAERLGRARLLHVFENRGYARCNVAPDVNPWRGRAQARPRSGNRQTRLIHSLRWRTGRMAQTWTPVNQS